MTRRTRASLVGGLAAVLLIVLILIGFFPQDVLRRYVERRLQQGLGPGSSVKRMHVLPWRMRTEVHDLVIEGPTYRLAVPRAQLILRPGFFFGTDLSFRSLELESPTLEVRASGDAKPYKPLDQPLIVEDLSVTNGRIIYHLGPDSRLTLEGVRLKGGVGTDAPLAVAITGGAWASDKTLDLGPGTGRLRVSSRLDVAIDTLDATVAHSKIHASGPLGRIGDLFPQIKFDADVDLRDLAAIGAGPEMSGRVKAEGMLEGLGKNMRLDAEIGGSRVRVGEWPIDRFDVHLAHTGGLPGRTDIKGDARLLGGSASGTVALRGTDTDARIRFAGIRVEELRDRGIALPWPEKGPVSGQITAQGGWDGALRVKAEANTAGPGPMQLALEVKAFAEGTVRLKARAVDLAFNVAVDGSRPAVGDPPRLRGLDVTLRGHARGPLPPTVDGGFDGSLRVEMASGQEPMPVKGTFRYDGGAYAFTANANGMGGTLVAQGEGRGSVLRRLHVEGNDVQIALVRPEADGVADFELAASGPFDRLTGTGTLDIQDLLWKDERVGHVTARVEGSQGQGRFTFAAPELRATGEGTFDRTAAHAVITLDQTPVDRLAAFLPFAQPVTGVTSGVLDVKIPFREPQAMTVDARLDRLELASGTINARATAPVVGHLRNGVLELDEFQAEGNGVVATVSGRLGLTPESPLDARLRFEMDLAKVPRPQTDLTLTGMVQGDVALSGTRGRPRAFGEVTFNAVTLQHPRATRVLTLRQGRMWLRGDAAEVENVRADVGGGWVELTGTIPVAALLPVTGALKLGLEPAEADLVLRWEGVQAAALVEALRPGPSRVAANLSGEARLAGTLGTWRDAHGALRLVPTDVRVQDLSLNVQPIVARLEEGRVTTDGLVLDVEGTQFRVDGSADLRSRTFEAEGSGTLELRALSPFLEEASLTGVADVDVAASGPFAHPNAAGQIHVKDASLRVRDIPQPLSQIRALVTLDRQGIQLTEGTAQLGGGTITFDGTARLAGLSVDDVRIAAKGSQLGIRYPLTRTFTGRTGQLLEDLKARVDADLTLTGKPGDFVLAGSLAVERSLYDSDINLEEALLAPEVPPAPSEPSRVLRAVGLNLAVQTANPFIIRNNLAQIEAEGGLVIRGDMDEPAPYGRFEILPGGKVFLQGREFAVEGGSLAFSGTTDPDVTVRASTLIKQPDQDIEATIVAEGVLPRLTLSLSSTPSLPEREIASLIATGKADAFTNPRWWVAGEQAAALLAGRFTRRVAKELIDLGLDQVDIQPELISREGEPSARFTFGKQVTPALKLIYSMGLSDPESQYYEAQYQLRPGRAVTIKLQRRFDGTFTYGAGQRISFGGPKRTPAKTFEPTQLSDVRLEGELLEFPELTQVIKAKPRQKKTYWDLLDDADRIRKRLVEMGHLEAVVDARLDDDVAVFTGVAGRRHRWVVEGMNDPPPIDDILRQALYAEEGEENARGRLLDELRRRGHLKATVEVRTRHEGDVHLMVFYAEPGPVVRADVTFPGATLLPPSRLLAAAGGAPGLITETRKAEEAIRAEYRKDHYLSAKAGPIRTAEQPGVIRVEVPIEEGARAVVAAIRFPGAEAVPQEKLAELAALQTGVPYDATAVNQAVLRLRDHYLSAGFVGIRITPRIVPVVPDLDVVFEIREGQAQVVGPVEIRGLRHTSEKLVRQQVRLKEGEPLDPRKLAAIERRLRDLGIFRRAVVIASQDQVARITLELEEAARYHTAWDVRYNAQDSFTGVLDGEIANLLGRGLSLGLRARGGRWVQEGRASLHIPSVVGFGDLTASAFYLRETIRTVFELQPELLSQTRQEQGLQIQQALHTFHPFEVLYGYRYRRTTCPTQGLPPVSRSNRRLIDPCDRRSLDRAGLLGKDPLTLDLGGMDISAVMDTRDSPINPSRGIFLSVNVVLAPKFLRSDFDYVREFVQSAFLTDLTDSITWAHGYSVGLIHTFGGQRLPYDELFRAGGPNTLRGFDLDSLGPRTSSNETLGGEAVLVINQELRYTHPVTGIGGALFYDAGDVFPTASDFGFKLRHNVGVGLRWDSSFGLLRIDLGIPLGRREGERSYQLYFGFGQAF